MKLFAAGDLVNTKGNRHFINDELKQIIQSCDFSICNFEAPIESDFMIEIAKMGPSVFQSRESIKIIKEAGFNVVSLANNHIYDYGDQGMLNTIEELEKNNVHFVGGGQDFNSAYDPLILEEKDVKIGFLAACENEFGCLYEDQNRAGYAWIFHSNIEDQIRTLKTQVDMIVMVVHAGVENVDFPLKEWRDRYKRLCDVGVDVIIGHHPHVPQGFEKYNDSFIFYSLGNFYFDSHGHETKSNDSYSVIFDIDKGGVNNFEIVYHKMIDGQTTLVQKDDVCFSFDDLNRYLGSDYEKLNNELVIKLYNDYYYNYYADVFGAKRKNVSNYKLFKTKIRNVLFKDVQKRNLLLLHNIRIDTHRFVVQRALSLLSE